VNVVSNTSPISNLCAIGQIQILLELYGMVRIPDAVQMELHASPRIASLARAAEEGGIFSVSSAYNTRTASLLRHTLDSGEAAAIALALETNAELLLMDERLGRSIAKQAGIRIMGVLGVLVEAKKRLIIPEITPLVSDLITIAKFRIAPALKAHVLAMAGEMPS
jgi:uncharacterized protein